MSSPDGSTIDTVSRLLASTDGLTVCYDPPIVAATDGFFGSLPAGLHPELSAHIVHTGSRRGCFGTNERRFST